MMPDQVYPDPTYSTQEVLDLIKSTDCLKELHLIDVQFVDEKYRYCLNDLWKMKAALTERVKEIARQDARKCLDFLGFLGFKLKSDE